MIKFKTLSALVVLSSLALVAKADPACWPQQAGGTGTVMTVGQDDKTHWITWYCPTSSGWTPMSLVDISPPSANLQKSGPELLGQLKAVYVRSGELNGVYAAPIQAKANIQLAQTKPR